MNMHSVLYVFTSAPYSNAMGQEGLDALLTGAAFEYHTSALFLHDGVFQLNQNQDNSSSELKQYTKAFGALKDFGVQNIYVFDASSIARGLDKSNLIIPVEVLDRQRVSKLINQQTRVFTF